MSLVPARHNLRPESIALRVRVRSRVGMEGQPRIAERRLAGGQRILGPLRKSLRTWSAADGKRERDQGLARRNAPFQQFGNRLGLGGIEALPGPTGEIRLNGREGGIDRNQDERHQTQAGAEPSTVGQRSPVTAGRAGDFSSLARRNSSRTRRSLSSVPRLSPRVQAYKRTIHIQAAPVSAASR